MTTFGLSAFLKLVNVSAKRQRSMIAERLKPAKKSGYDFHKAMRGICGGYLVGGVSLEDSVAAAKAIVKDAERRSAVAALTRVVEWRREFPEKALTLEGRTYESPTGVFKVRLDIDFAPVVDGQRVAIHLWNTKWPDLEPRLTRGALALFPDLYGEARPDDLAVLSLRSGQLIRLGEDSEAHAIGVNIIEALEDIFIDLRLGERRPMRKNTQRRSCFGRSKFLLCFSPYRPVICRRAMARPLMQDTTCAGRCRRLYSSLQRRLGLQAFRTDVDAEFVYTFSLTVGITVTFPTVPFSGG